jgi:hypothetical protein
MASNDVSGEIQVIIEGTGRSHNGWASKVTM